MQPLTLDDLMPLAEYIGRRAEFFAANARYLDRYRRVRIGPTLTVVFENRQTLWYRIHELLRVARLADPARVQTELAVFNRLLPGHGNLQAALFIDLPDDSKWTEQNEFWSDLTDGSVQLHSGAFESRARLVTCRPEDRCAGTAHWLEFTIDGSLRRALSDRRAAAFISAEHRTYQHRSTSLSDAIRGSLSDDLELSDRDQAA